MTNTNVMIYMATLTAVQDIEREFNEMVDRRPESKQHWYEVCSAKMLGALRVATYFKGLEPEIHNQICEYVELKLDIIRNIAYNTK